LSEDSTPEVPTPTSGQQQLVQGVARPSPRYIDDLIVALIVKIGDMKPNIKDTALDCLDMLGEERNTKPSLVASLLYRKKGLPKVCEDPKHLVV
jgi:hypothetical protein